MSATVASFGTLHVLEIAPERNGWTADIIRRWPGSGSTGPPAAGRRRSRRPSRCSSFRPGAPSIVSWASTKSRTPADLGVVVAELAERHRHRPVDDLEHPAAGQALVLDQRDVGLDPGRVAVHHEGDRAGRREDGHLAVAVAVLAAQCPGTRPRRLRASASRSGGDRAGRSPRRRRGASPSPGASARGSGRSRRTARGCPACSALVRYAWPCMIAVIAPASARPSSES